MVKRPNVSPLNHIKSYRIPSDVWLSVQEASAMVEALAEASPGPPPGWRFFSAKFNGGSTIRMIVGIKDQLLWG